jgi:poly-gamma-glutamate synthesis protein (capsule biosynthesis protein)
MTAQPPPSDCPATLTLFLGGDVMTGRGVDQVLPHPGDPALHEPFTRSADEYVRLAEAANGPIPRPVDPSYIWGEALAEFRRIRPDLRLVNLETAVTASNDYDRGKEIHYRMHPANVGCLTAAGIHCCGLANNHVLDWGRAGLLETLDCLGRAGISTAGAGRNLDEAMRPAVFSFRGKGRVLVFACGCESAGVAPGWAATKMNSGVWLIDEDSPTSAHAVASSVQQWKRPEDIVILSIHWGGNWGYEIPRVQQVFARNVVDHGGVDVVHGHSSHHVKGVEVYRDRAILYGCGDFLTDYEGIPGREEFRDDLGLMYFVTVDVTTGALQRLEMTPTQLKRFRLTRPSSADRQWLAGTHNREGRRPGTSVENAPDDRLLLRWHR